MENLYIYNFTYLGKKSLMHFLSYHCYDLSDTFVQKAAWSVVSFTFFFHHYLEMHVQVISFY